MDNDQPSEVRRVLEENDLDAEQVLIVLARTLTARHIDRELRRLGRRVPWPGQPRPDALNSTMDALYEAGAKIDQARQQAEEEGAGGQAQDSAENIPKLLMQMLTACQFIAEREAGIGGDDDDKRPLMRIVPEE